jgi:hypothetical protein
MFLKFHGLVVAVHKNAGNAQGGFSPTDAGLINVCQPHGILS